MPVIGNLSLFRESIVVLYYLAINNVFVVHYVLAGVARRMDQPGSSEVAAGAPAGEFTDIGVTSGYDNGSEPRSPVSGPRLEEVSLDDPDGTGNKRAPASGGPISTIAASHPAVSTSMSPSAEATQLPPTVQQAVGDTTMLQVKDTSLSAR